MKKFLVADGGNADGTAKDRDGTNPGTKYLAKYYNDNIFNLFEFVQSQGYTLIDGDLSQIAKASKSKYNPNYTYNTSSIATQSVNDIVLGSDGKYYEAQTNGINGDNPVGSETENWQEVLFDNSTLLKDFSKYASKIVPVNADLLVLSDSEDSNNNKKVSFEDLKNSLGSSGVLSIDSFLHIQDQKTSGTDGGSSIAGTQTRDLNTILNNSIGASLSSNVITLPAGDYYCESFATSYRVDNTKLKIRDTTNSLDLVIGLNDFSDNSFATGASQKLFGSFTLSASTDIELQHYTQSAKSVNGLGLAVSQGIEVYSDIRIWKVG